MKMFLEITKVDGASHLRWWVINLGGFRGSRDAWVRVECTTCLVRGQESADPHPTTRAFWKGRVMSVCVCVCVAGHSHGQASLLGLKGREKGTGR